MRAINLLCRVSEITDEAESLSAVERRGVTLACFTLGRCFQLGQAVTQDHQKALHYFTKVGIFNSTPRCIMIDVCLHVCLHEQAKKYDKTAVAELHTQVINGLL